MFNFKLLEEDVSYISYIKEEIPHRINNEKFTDSKHFSVKTPNIEAIFSRDELLSSILFTESDDLNNYCIISIAEPFQKQAKTSLKINCKDLIQLEFTDIRKELNDEFLEEHKDSIKIISNEDIEDITQFIFKNKGNKFIINCDAGISRSAAIGVYLEHLIGDGNNIEDIKSHKRYSANPIIIKKLNI